MRTLKLTIAYDGTGYVGWQVQPNGTSIQEVLEKAWSSVTGETRRIIASGRTDSGVHALGQVCSLDTSSTLPAERLEAALNAHLPGDIRVLSVEEAPAGFHAIRDAVAKTYRYHLQLGPRADLFRRLYSWHVTARVDVEAMRTAARHLLGTHDFSGYESAGAPRRDTVRTLSRLTIDCTDAAPFRHATIEVTANGFLYNMVRNIVGTLVDIGRERFPSEYAATVLEQRDRTLAGPTAPAHGLFLVSVEYRVDAVA